MKLKPTGPHHTTKQKDSLLTNNFRHGCDCSIAFDAWSSYLRCWIGYHLQLNHFTITLPPDTTLHHKVYCR